MNDDSLHIVNTFHRHLEQGSEVIADAATSAALTTIALTATAATLATAGRSKKDAEVANHFNSKLKYGIAGTKGSLFSNYIAHALNNHELLSLLFADKRNPYNRKRRLFIIFSKLSLSFFLAALLSTTFSDEKMSRIGFRVQSSFLISLVLCPFGYLLEKVARCGICSRRNTCIKFATTLGYFTLALISTLSILFLVLGIVIVVYDLKLLGALGTERVREGSFILKSFFE
jgi:hypothetical protein